MPPSVAPVHFWTPGRLASGMAIVSGLAVLLTLADPGLTIDEPLDVRPGRTYVATLRARGWHFFDREVVTAVFRDNAEHPPLGRWLLGIASTLGEPFEILLRGPDPVGLYVLSGRLAPALAFAVLVGLVVATAARRFGRPAGLLAGLALLAMPRVFAHAHLAALDTFLSLFWLLALLSAERALEHPRPVVAMAGASVFLALALLTKIHAWFLFPVMGIWALWRLRTWRAIFAVSTWGVTGLALFVTGWPWLWYDFLPRLRGYLGTGVERIPIQVGYFGQVYADRAVPWHYPWFYFAVTVPIGLQALGVLGLIQGVRQRRDDPLPVLLAVSIGVFLVVFSTRIPVYDGERLFLLVFPPWAILIGRGFASVWSWSARRTSLRWALGAIVLLQGYGVVAFHPFGLSYYNALVGGLPGAERLGLELTYWGDAVDGVVLDRLVRQIPPGESAALAPTLYPGQGALTTTRPMFRRGLVLKDEEYAPTSPWIVVYRRTAYWKPVLRTRLARAPVVFSRSRQGVWLSRIVANRP
jgi:4-amino-4-deoxy-L-arabinose transferase-like glycosyltransferase